MIGRVLDFIVLLIAMRASASACDAALQISALDMTCEAVVTKMAYLLSLNVPPRTQIYHTATRFCSHFAAASPRRPQHGIQDVAARGIDRCAAALVARQALQSLPCQKNNTTKTQNRKPVPLTALAEELDSASLLRRKDQRSRL